MCFSKPSKPETPAPAPPPPIDGPTAPTINEKSASARNSLAANKAGRGSLRVDLASSGAGSGAGNSSGLAIPS